MAAAVSLTSRIILSPTAPHDDANVSTSPPGPTPWPFVRGRPHPATARLPTPGATPAALLDERWRHSCRSSSWARRHWRPQWHPRSAGLGQRERLDERAVPLQHASATELSSSGGMGGSSLAAKPGGSSSSAGAGMGGGDASGSYSRWWPDAAMPRLGLGA